MSGGARYDYIGGPERPVWTRGPKPKRKAPKVITQPFAMLRVVREVDDIVHVEVAALGELPSLSLTGLPQGR